MVVAEVILLALAPILVGMLAESTALGVLIFIVISGLLLQRPVGVLPVCVVTAAWWFVWWQPGSWRELFEAILNTVRIATCIAAISLTAVTLFTGTV